MLLSLTLDIRQEHVTAFCFVNSLLEAKERWKGNLEAGPGGATRGDGVLE